MATMTGHIFVNIKGLNVLFISTDNSSLKKILTAPLQEQVFSSENFRVSRKYKAMAAKGAMEGTVQEGSTPTWMEVVFVTTF